MLPGDVSSDGDSSNRPLSNPFSITSEHSSSNVQRYSGSSQLRTRHSPYHRGYGKRQHRWCASCFQKIVEGTFVREDRVDARLCRSAITAPVHNCGEERSYRSERIKRFHGTSHTQTSNSSEFGVGIAETGRGGIGTTLCVRASLEARKGSKLFPSEIPLLQYLAVCPLQLALPSFPS